MKIKVKDIPSEGIEIKAVLPMRSVDVDRDYWQLVDDISLTIHGQRISDRIYLKIGLGSEKRIVCSRCLEEVIAPYELEFDWQDKITDELAEIDIDEIVRQEILLNIGIRELCADDCKGICPTCGGNRNKGECTC